MPQLRTKAQRERVDPIARSVEQTRRALSTMYSNNPGYEAVQDALTKQVEALMLVDPNFQLAVTRAMSNMVADDYTEKAADALLSAGLVREVSKVVPIKPQTKRRAGAK